MKVGELLKMEFFMPDEAPVTYTAEVVWIEPLPAGALARFDVGLKFIQLEPATLRLLAKVLGPPEGEAGEGTPAAEAADAEAAGAANSGGEPDTSGTGPGGSAGTGSTPA